MINSGIMLNSRYYGSLVLKGNIAFSSDFPTLSEVELGDFYIIISDVTDNDATKTNTGQVFTAGEKIFWDGTDWSVLSETDGTVNSVSVVSANGLAGTVSNPSTTPEITLSTTISGILKGNATAISAATSSDIISSLGYTPEDVANKAINFSTVNNNLYPSVLAVKNQLDLKIDKNTAITGETKTKITYDADGLVVSGVDATTADIADSLNKRYVSDAGLAVLGNTSNTNTGDQDLSGLVSKVVMTDNAVARANGTDGTLQNSTVTISDLGVIAAGGFSSTGSIGSDSSITAGGSLNVSKFVAGNSRLRVSNFDFTSTSDATFDMYASAGNVTQAFSNNSNDIVWGLDKTDNIFKMTWDYSFASGFFLQFNSSGEINLPLVAASSSLELDSSKNIVGVTNTGTGNNVKSDSPSLTGLVSVAATGANTVLKIGTGNSDSNIVNHRVYSSSGVWRGSAAYGGSNVSVIMGELAGKATIGGHNSSLSAWGDLYIQASNNTRFGSHVTPTKTVDITGTLGVSSGAEFANNVKLSAATALTGLGLDASKNIVSVPYSYGEVTGIALQWIAHATGVNLTTYWNGTPTLSGGVSFASGVFTVATAGFYQVTGSFSYQTNGAGARSANIRVNNSALVGYQNIAPVSNDRTGMNFSCIHYLNAGDNVRILAYQGSGVTLRTDGAIGGRFSIVKVGGI